MKVFKTYSLIIVIVLAGCTSKIEYQRVSGYALGTTYNITYFDTKVNPEVLPAIDSVFYVLNKSMSTYIKNSDISKSFEVLIYRNFIFFYKLLIYKCIIFKKPV